MLAEEDSVAESTASVTTVDADSATPRGDHLAAAPRVPDGGGPTRAGAKREQALFPGERVLREGQGAPEARGSRVSGTGSRR